MNCVTQHSLCQRFNVQAYPSFYLFSPKYDPIASFILLDLSRILFAVWVWVGLCIKNQVSLAGAVGLEEYDSCGMIANYMSLLLVSSGCDNSGAIHAQFVGEQSVNAVVQTALFTHSNAWV